MNNNFVPLAPQYQNLRLQRKLPPTTNLPITGMAVAEFQNNRIFGLQPPPLRPAGYPAPQHRMVRPRGPQMDPLNPIPQAFNSI